MKKYLKYAIAMLIACIMIAETPLSKYVAQTPENVKAEDTIQPKGYVSDLRLYTTSAGKGKSAISKAEKEGYTLLTQDGRPVDLNKGIGKDDVLLGYKLSDKKKDAITDIKMLEMDHGYEWFNYQKIAEGQAENTELLASEIMVAGEEFRTNLKNGSRTAKAAKSFLNTLFFTKKIPYEVRGVKYNVEESVLLGDYLSSGNMEMDMLKKLVIQMNTGALTAMYTQLALAVSEEGTTWADRISQTKSFKENDSDSDMYKVWDKSYYARAYDILPKLKDYAANYRQTEMRKANNDGEVSGIPADKVSEDEDANIDPDGAEKVMEESSKDNAGDLVCEAAQGILDSKTVGDERLGDYIVRLAEDKYETKKDYRKLYPIVEALSEGQFAMLKAAGVAQMALYLDITDDFFAELDNRKAEAVAKFKEATGSNKASVWEGVNTEFYEREVALTSEAYRQAKASSVYSQLTKEGEFYENMSMAFMYVGLGASVSILVTSSIAIGLVIAGSELSVWAACASLIGQGVVASVGGVLGCTCVIVGWVALVALVVMAIVYFVKWLIDKYSDDDDEEYTVIPPEIYDIVQTKVDGMKTSQFIKYDPVKNSKGRAQDLNADEGKRWNVLYSTKNADGGSPICLDQLEKCFVQTVNSPGAPSGYKSVTCFGERSAANMNSYTKGDNDALFLHFKTLDTINNIEAAHDDEVDEAAASDDVEAFGGAVNTGIKAKINPGEKYLSSLVVSKEKSESAAKAFITQKPGYKIYDRNLSPGNGFTYLGYSTTTIKKEAIKDIRVLNNYKDDNILYGDAEYVSAGKLPGGADLVYTQYASAGHPILETFKILDKQLGEEADGWEPVNSFGGGDAYGFGHRSIFSQEKNTMYMYFKPAVMYPSGDKYIAGVRFITEQKCSESRSAKQLARDMGVKLYDTHSLSSGIDYLKEYEKGNIAQKYLEAVTFGYYESPKYKWTSHEQYVGVTYTYNPYRAVTDLALHTATPSLRQMPLSFCNPDGNYIAAECDIVSNLFYYRGFHSDNAFVDTNDEDDEFVYASKSRAYSNPYSDSKLLTNNDDYYFDQKQELEDNISFEKSNWRLQALYQLGHIVGKKPLKEADLVVTNSSSVPSGMHSVTRFADPYNANPVNIAWEDSRSKCKKVFMYLKGKPEQRAKYISGLYVSSYQRPSNTNKHTYSELELKQYDKLADDNAILKLCNKIKGEVINYNLAVNQKSAWYRNPEKYPGKATYIGVTRTNNEDNAITGIVMYKSKKLSPIKIKVNGIEYHRTGDKCGDYYLYYTKSPGANPGVPIEEIFFNDVPIVDGSATAVGVTGNEKGEVDYLNDFSGCNGFLHMKATLDESVICDIGIEKGEKNVAQMNLMRKGYNYVVKESLNANAGGTPVWLGYKMCSADVLDIMDDESYFEDGDDLLDDDEWNQELEDCFGFDIDFDIAFPEEDVVRDVLATVGEDYKESFMHEGREYQAVSDISLNEGTSGKKIYLYVSKDSNSKALYLPAVSDIVLCSGGAVPYTEADASLYNIQASSSDNSKSSETKSNDDNSKSSGSTSMTDESVMNGNSRYGVWEKLLDNHGIEVNINDGVIKTESSDKHIVDSRLYLFVQRYDGKVKPGAEITRGYVNDSIDKSDILLAP